MYEEMFYILDCEWKSKPDEIPSHPSQGDYENKPQQQKHPWLCSKKKEPSFIAGRNINDSGLCVNW